MGILQKTSDWTIENETGKKPLSSVDCQKCVYQRALQTTQGMASTIESEIGKNPWLTLNSPYYSNAYVYVKHTLQKTPERLRPLKVKLGKTRINIG